MKSRYVESAELNWHSSETYQIRIQLEVPTICSIWQEDPGKHRFGLTLLSPLRHGWSYTTHSKVKKSFGTKAEIVSGQLLVA